MTELKRNDVKSCGCFRKKQIEDIDKKMIGTRFGRLVVKKKSNNQASNGNFFWSCECDCGNQTEVRKRNLEEGTTKSCGCLQSELTSERMKQNIGEKHPLWNQSFTIEERELRRQTPDYKAWRMNVFIRDKFNCKVCGSNQKIEAHHILNYSSHKEFRYKAANGITLCEVCHNNFHNIYGRTNNNENQFLQYLHKIRGVKYAKTIKELLSKDTKSVVNPNDFIEMKYKVYSDSGAETFHLTKLDITKVYGFKDSTIENLLKSGSYLIKKEVVVLHQPSRTTNIFETYRQAGSYLGTSEHTIRRKAKKLINNRFNDYFIDENITKFYIQTL